MFAVSLLVPFLAAASAPASARSADVPRSDHQVVLEDKGALSYPDTNPFVWVNAVQRRLKECPPDLPCGANNDTFICSPRYAARCPQRAGPLYADVRVLVGCESLPATAPLCPRNSCDSNCLCRESLLRRLTKLLLERTDDSFEDVYSAGDEEL